MRKTIHRVCIYRQAFTNITLHIDGYFIADYCVFRFPTCNIVQMLNVDGGAVCAVGDQTLLSFSNMAAYCYVWNWTGHAYEMRD